MSQYPLPPRQAFAAIMQRTVQLIGQKVPREVLQEMAQAIGVLRWEFRDYGLETYFVVGDTGEVSWASQWQGEVQSSISMDARTFHDAALGKTSFSAAFLMGKLRVQGIPALKLGEFALLLKPFLESYQQALEEHYGRAT